MKNPTSIEFTDSIVEEILDLTLKEKKIIAYMDENDVFILEAILERYVESKGAWINDGKNIVKRVWAKLYDSHRFKVVE